MVKKIKNTLSNIKINRTTILLVAFGVMSFVLIQRLFTLQIVDGQQYADNFSLSTTKERTLKSTRGNIYDRNGNILASNELSYSVTLEDSGTYANNRERNLSLNSEIYKLIHIIETNGDSIDRDFHIILDENGEYSFDVKDLALDRFRADVYGHSLIDDLTSTEASASATTIMSYLYGKSRFSIVLESDSPKPYTAAELEEYGLPEEFSKEELLKLVTVRYTLSTNSYKKYMPVTIATDVGEDTVAAIMENQNQMEGIDIQEESIRVYSESVYFSSLLGYTGKASSEELDTLKEDDDRYTTNSIIGKTGIEEVMETTLQGTNGSETVYVDNLGKVLQIDNASRVDPVQGNDVYLTIDKELQIAVYNILEQRIAGILLENIVPLKQVEWDANTDSSAIPIPIYDVYFALINNSLIDISHFSADQASETERNVQLKFEQKQEQVFNAITQELTGDAPLSYSELTEELQEYIDYIVNDMLMDKTGIFSETSIDKSDATYLAWTNKSISLQEYLTYAASQNWIDISAVTQDQTYLNAKEAYQALAAYIAEYLKTDTAFSKLLYYYMLMEDTISGDELCTILYDQAIFLKDDGLYQSFAGGQLSSYDLLREKIKSIELTPAQLALEPCSGSAVITDPDSGEILACVTYPGYDNNRLANQMDAGYYRQLTNDLSEPFYNKATQQRTAPGSTFKLVTTVAALTENVIDDESTITCHGSFEKIEGSPLKCWDTSGHGVQTIREAIQNSCNVFFSELAYRMGTDESGVFSDTAALQKIETYAKLFDLDKNSGIEISEAAPQISNELPIPSAIGQGTHSYTTSQLARYVTTIANSGTSYDISLLDKTTDSDGNIIEDFTPRIESKLEVSQDIWDDIHYGMRHVITVTNSEAFGDLEVSLAGKTGTAQHSKNRANHGLFIGYAPYEEPEIAMAVRIAYGYSSANTAMVAKDICNYYFDLKDESEVLTGTAAVASYSDQQQD